MIDPRPVTPLTQQLDATMTLPGSKSITNRALVCAALAEGTSRLRGALESDDTEAMIGALGALGIEVTWDSDTLVVKSAGRIGPGPAKLHVAMSGTTSRFLLPLLATGSGHYELDGHPALRKRPMGESIRAIRRLGGDLSAVDDEYLPAVINASGLTGGEVDVSGDISSQFLTGLLLSGPAMERGLDVVIETQMVSKPYLEMTADVMELFGGRVEASDDLARWLVHPARYESAEIDIEPDASTASYFFAAAVIVGGRVRVQHLDASSIQGDIGFVEILAQMGADVTYGDGWTEVRCDRQLRGITADMSDISDTVQSLAVIAPYCSGPTEITNVGFIRKKETDRLSAVATELRRCGIDATDTSDGLVIQPGEPQPAVIQTYDDHRMAMSFSLLGLRSEGIQIADPGCVSKTVPAYWEKLDELSSFATGDMR